jgi:hypothetical protein
MYCVKATNEGHKTVLISDGRAKRSQVRSISQSGPIEPFKIHPIAFADLQHVW